MNAAPPSSMVDGWIVKDCDLQPLTPFRSPYAFPSFTTRPRFLTQHSNFTHISNCCSVHFGDLPHWRTMFDASLLPPSSLALPPPIHIPVKDHDDAFGSVLPA